MDDSDGVRVGSTPSPPPPPPFRGPPALGIGCSRVRRAGCQALKPPRAEEAEDWANRGLARGGCGRGAECFRE